jgi:hypothetical protein
VPIPTAEKDHHYTIGNVRPQVLPDGRIVLQVIHQTDTPDDDYSGQQLAIWDPETDKVELQGLLDSFVLAQPEIKSCNCDAEGGHMMGEAFAISPDGKYAYFTAGASGTEMWVHHDDHHFLARWDLSSRSNERMVYTDSRAIAWGVTDDGDTVVVVDQGKYKLLDPAKQTLTEVDPYGSPVLAGMIAGDAFVKGWRGCDYGAYGGVAYFDANALPGYRVVDGEKLPENFKGLGEPVQLSADAKSIYFMASTDHCTNYASPWAIYQVPAGREVTAQAVKLVEMEPRYLTAIFILLDK